MGNYEIKHSELLNAYEQHTSKKANMPEWAVHMAKEPEKIVLPTIPFLGKEYEEQKIKILVYASAEVLSDYICVKDGNSTRPWLDDKNTASDRHRFFFDNRKKEKESFFPNVHIQPLNDGYLATAVYYIANKIIGNVYENPEEFYETIAFGNYGKFTIETDFQKNIRLFDKREGSKKNIDYAKDKTKLSASHDYLSTDMKLLRPNYIIMPESIYNTDKEFIDEVKGDAKIITICQMNRTCVNTHLSKKHDKYCIEDLPCEVKQWFENLYGGMENRSKTRYLSVFTYLDKELAKQEVSYGQIHERSDETK